MTKKNKNEINQNQTRSGALLGSQSGSDKINKKKQTWMIAVIGIIMIFMGFSAFYAIRQLNDSSDKNRQNVQVNADVEGAANHEGIENNSTSDIASHEADSNDSEADKDYADENQLIENKSDENQNNNKETGSVRIVMVGDVLLHTPVSDSGLMEDGTYNYDHLFAHVKDDISSADLAIVNQEVILGGRELGLSGYPTFNGAYEVGDALVAAGFDVVLHATNHALDKGKTGIVNCLNFWRMNYPEIGVLGINDSEEMQSEIYIKDVNGIKIAILNYTYGTNGISMPEDMPFAVNLIDREKIARDMEIAREQADFIIVCPHWGIEYTHNENNEQRELAQFFAEQGADLIMGAHPHVIQPVRWVEASNGNRALVYYSLGNFINATSEYGSGVADRMIGAMADVTVEMDESGNVLIADYKAVPLVTQMLTGSGRITTYKLSDYSQELAEQNEVRERDAAFSYDYCVRVSKEVLSD